MKKIYLAFIFLCAASFLFAQTKRIAIFNPESEGLSEEDDSWIPSSVRRKLESNFNLYTSFQLVEIQNEAELKMIQKKADSSAYDEDTSIELGKLVSAEYGVFSTITKIKDKYILSSSITNLSTGVRLSSITTDSVSDSVALFEGAGCSVNHVIVQFCMDLHIPLSSTDVYKLLKNQDVSNNQEIDLMEEELSKYNEYKKELDSKIKELNLSVDLEKESLKVRLEAEREMIEQQEKIAKERIQRLKKENEQYLKDIEDEKLRSQEQRDKINEVQKEIEEKVSSLQKEKIDNLSVDAQIAAVEAKKVALVELRESIDKQIEYINQEAQNEYEKRVLYIDQEPLRKGELDSNGNMIPSVKANRERQKESIKKEVFSRAKEDIAELKNKTLSQEKALLQAIDKDYAALSKKRSISSLDDDRIFFVENYAGEKYQWNVNVSLFINDSSVFTQNVGLYYKNVSGKLEANPDNPKLWNEYLDTVDLYDYMFRRKVPVIALEIDYTIEPMDEKYPSSYLITIEQFRFIDTRSHEVIQYSTPPQRLFRLNVNPAVDIRSRNVSHIKNTSLPYTDALSIEEDKKERENKNKEAEKEKEIKVERKKQNPKVSIGCGMGTTLFDEEVSPYVKAYIALPFGDSIFYEIDCISFLSEDFEIEDDESSLFDDDFLFLMGLGTNKRIFLNLDLYVYAACGIFSTTDIYFEDELTFAFSSVAGIDIPICPGYLFSFEMSAIYTSITQWDYLWGINFVIGI